MKSPVTPLVSVIVPIYNAEKYLYTCIESIINQEYTNMEIILVNDGSIDDSEKICAEYQDKDKRIKFINKQNEGVSIARNRGLEVATGDWCIFVDSDDAIESHYINYLMNLVESKDCLVLTGAKRINRYTSEVLWIKQFENAEISLEDRSSLKAIDGILEYGTICGKLFNLSIIRNNNLTFNSSLSLNEDHLFYLNYLFYVDKIKTNNKLGYLYFVDTVGNSLSTNTKHPAAARMLAYKTLLNAYDKLLVKIGACRNDFPQMSSFIISIVVHLVKGMMAGTILLNPPAKKDILTKENLLLIKSYYQPKTLFGKVFKYYIALKIALLRK